MHTFRSTILTPHRIHPDLHQKTRLEIKIPRQKHDNGNSKNIPWLLRLAYTNVTSYHQREFHIPRSTKGMTQPKELPCTQQHDEEAATSIIKTTTTPPLYKQQQQAFYLHVCVFAVSMIIMFVVNLATNLSAGIANEWRAWWCLWALLGWTIGIAVHRLVLLLNRPAS